MALLNRADLTTALTRMGELAMVDGIELEFIAVGGAVMVLEFGVRLSTHDFDAVVVNGVDAARVRSYAATVAGERAWPLDWLNDGAKGYLTGHVQPSVLLSAPGIRVSRPAIEQLLAMKLCAWRDDVDIADAERLLAELPGDRESAWDIPPARPGVESAVRVRRSLGGTGMMPLEEIARSALSGDALATRALVQDWLLRSPRVADEPPPSASADPITAALAASLAELLAGRLKQPPPGWAAEISSAPSPVFLLRAAARMRRLREMCVAESPPPLRRRNFFAPANYLESV